MAQNSNPVRLNSLIDDSKRPTFPDLITITKEIALPVVSAKEGCTGELYTLKPVSSLFFTYPFLKENIRVRKLKCSDRQRVFT